MKEFVLKTHTEITGERLPIDPKKLVHEKIAYDLLKYFGVTVPKSYLVLSKDQQEIIGIATEKLPNATSLRDHFEELTVNERKQILKSRQLNGKPIYGLYAWSAQFVVTMDRDGIGAGFGNILLVEHARHYQAIKIDPGEACLSKMFLGYIQSIWFFYDDKDEPKAGLSHDLSSGCLLKLFEQNVDWRFNDVFQHATSDEILTSLATVCSAPKEDLQEIIFNPALPEKFLPLKDRQKILDIIWERVERLRSFYKKELKDFPSFLLPSKRMPPYQNRYFLTEGIDLNETGFSFATGQSKPTIWNKNSLPAKHEENHKSLFTALQNSTQSALNTLKIIESGSNVFSIFSSPKAFHQVKILESKFQSSESYHALINAIISYFELGNPENKSLSFQDNSFETAFLQALIGNIELKKLLNIEDIRLPKTITERKEACDQLIAHLNAIKSSTLKRSIYVRF